MRVGDKKTLPIADAVVKDVGGMGAVRPDSGVRSVLSDKVDISESAKSLGRARALMNTIPDIRTDKVKSLKDVIESGMYNIEAEKVAVKIIERAIRDAIYVRNKK